MATNAVHHSFPATCSLLLNATTTASDTNSKAASARFLPLNAVGLGPAWYLSTKGSYGRSVPLKAAKSGAVEPDLPEDNTEDTRTAGEDEEDTFAYGYTDGHHTFHKEDAEVDVWEAIKEVFVSAGGPTGGQAVLAWGTLPALFLMMAYNIQVEYIFLGIVLFIFAFIGIEMAKPDQDHELPPEIYKERRKNRLSQNTVE